jgi:hypothetical protein
MTEETKRQMIKAYFKKFPTWAVLFVLIGIICLLAGLNGSGGALVTGLVLCGLGGFAIYSATSGKPSDQQMDEWLEEDLRMLTDKSLTKMNTEKEELVSESVQVSGPRLWDVGGADVLWRTGKDKKARFTPVGVCVISFTQNQLLGYTCALDRTTGKALNESTDEYFYKDVVSVATKTESKTVKIQGIKDAIQMTAAELFTLTTSGGTKLEVFLRADNLIQTMGGGEIETTRAEKAIQTVRKMLRDKKGDRAPASA